MSAAIVSRNSPPMAPAERTARDPGPCWRELLQLALDGSDCCDPRLEPLLDRIGRPT